MNTHDAHTAPSFSLKNRVGRLVWNAVYFIFIRYSLKPMHGWRAFWFRLFGAHIGPGVHIYPGVRVWAPWNIELKAECGIANGVKLYSQGRITIGRRAVISQGSHLCAGTHDYTTPGFPLITKPIVVGDFAWLAAEVFVHPGISIGEGAVIGARSVVVSDMREWQICSGFPCREIRPRIEADEINSFRNSFK